MAVQNAILGYWKHFFGALAIVLAAFFAYGQYTSWQESAQQALSQQIATVESDLMDQVAAKVDPVTRELMVTSSWNVDEALARARLMKPDQMMSLYSAPGFMKILGAQQSAPNTLALLSLDSLATAFFLAGDLDEVTKADVMTAADRLVAIGAGSSGAASAQALVDAADLYARLGDVAKQKATLEVAMTRGDGPIAHGAGVAVANLTADAGDVDGALAILRKLQANPDPYLAQDAGRQIGRMLEFAGRKDEALAEYAAFVAKWPDAPMTVDIKARQARLGGLPVPAPPVEVKPEAGG